MHRDIAARKIPIKNIYHMLSYAWDSLKVDEEINLESEDFHNIYNLLAKIYLRGLNAIVKRGLYKDYIGRQEELGVLRGKVNVKESINSLSFLRNKMACDYDEFSADNTLNRIVKATIALLMKNGQLGKAYKQGLKTYQPYFSEIKVVELSRHSFNKLRYNRNNIHYKMLMDISQLIYDGLLVKEEEGKVEFLDFIRDKQLANLYEKFILNFYKSELPKKYKIHSPIINWEATGLVEEDEKYLPIMRTDIVVEDKRDKIQHIMDTKFYSETLSKSQYKQLGSINSSNLYQIYSYVNNSKYDGEIRGTLLYPRVDESIDADYKIGDNIISIKTVDLNDQWENIKERLISLIK